LTLVILREYPKFEDANLPVCYEERRRSRAKAPRPAGEVKTAELQRRIATVLTSSHHPRSP
jgi:hypothetical protein